MTENGNGKNAKSGPGKYDFPRGTNVVRLGGKHYAISLGEYKEVPQITLTEVTPQMDLGGESAQLEFWASVYEGVRIRGASDEWDILIRALAHARSQKTLEVRARGA